MSPNSNGRPRSANMAPCASLSSLLSCHSRNCGSACLHYPPAVIERHSHDCCAPKGTQVSCADLLANSVVPESSLARLGTCLPSAGGLRRRRNHTWMEDSDRSSQSVGPPASPASLQHAVKFTLAEPDCRCSKCRLRWAVPPRRLLYDCGPAVTLPVACQSIRLLFLPGQLRSAMPA